MFSISVWGERFICSYDIVKRWRSDSFLIYHPPKPLRSKSLGSGWGFISGGLDRRKTKWEVTFLSCSNILLMYLSPSLLLSLTCPHLKALPLLLQIVLVLFGKSKKCIYETDSFKSFYTRWRNCISLVNAFWAMFVVTHAKCIQAIMPLYHYIDS